ncbi:hypothetical protein ACFP1H_11665 [Secundilactobacillus hailunensis]|uniref:Uncharacterized protein n=1 Tax=Secundilactobacillus hailunensis TaxID=2559923 RepID=A0ABW1TBZ2_9LACO|nr:hypothetical protein [Secundilactobacillus hailunensis]
MFSTIVPAIFGIHGVGTIRVFHWLFRENPVIGFGFLLAIILYSIYRYNNRH